MREKSDLRKRLGHIDHRAGIYAIINRQNQHKYVGQSKDLQERIFQHFSELRAGRHTNSYLLKAYQLYGDHNFVAVVLEYVSRYHELDEREQYWIEQLKPEYNSIMDVLEAKQKFSLFHQAVKRDFDEPLIIREGETFERPEWHSWVYGGARNPQKDGSRKGK